MVGRRQYAFFTLVRRRGIVLVVLAAASLVGLTPAAGVGATNVTAAKPTNLKLVINGRTLTAAQPTQGPDDYLKVGVGRLTVGAKWTGNIKGSGYYILVLDSSSKDRKQCRAGRRAPFARARESRSCRS